jgi:hypothetical protein
MIRTAMEANSHEHSGVLLNVIVTDGAIVTKTAVLEGQDNILNRTLKTSGDLLPETSHEVLWPTEELQ